MRTLLLLLLLEIKVAERRNNCYNGYVSNDKKLSLLKDILGDCFYTQSGKGAKEYLFYCPFCDSRKQKLSINIEKGVSKCWVCNNTSKNLSFLVKKFGTSSHIASWNELEGNAGLDLSITSIDDIFAEPKPTEQLELPKEFISLSAYNPKTNKAKQYLKKRRLTQHDIVRWKMGVCLEGKYKERVIIPSFNSQGRLDFFVARSYTKHPIPYLNPAIDKNLIFDELFLDWNEDIVLVEGVFDAIVAGNAIPLLGSTLPEHSYIFNKVVTKKERVYIALDPDAEDKENAIVRNFLTYGVEVCKIEVDGWKDVGEMPREVFQERKRNAIILNRENRIEMVLRR